MFAHGFTKCAVVAEMAGHALIDGAAQGVRALAKGSPGGKPSFARTLGRKITTPIRWTGHQLAEAGRATRKAVTDFGKGMAEPFGRKREVGANLLKVQKRKIALNQKRKEPIPLKHVDKKSIISDKTKLTPTEEKSELKSIKEKVQNRKKGIRNSGKGPGFMGRHPLLTAGAGALAYKTLTSDKKEEPAPYVYQGG